MKFLSIEEYNQLPTCPSCNTVRPTDLLDAHNGYCMNCAIAGGQVYCEGMTRPQFMQIWEFYIKNDTVGIPQGIAIVCTRCGAQNPRLTTYGNEDQVFCSNCSPLEPEEEE